MFHYELFVVYLMLALFAMSLVANVVYWRRGVWYKVGAITSGLFVVFICYGIWHQTAALYVFR
jgi:hypothetical protein